jgi:anaphase-promoting complex subunit 10
VWSASSSKAGHGLGLVRDRSVATYWQSDGTAPHTVTLEWPFRACVAELLFFFDRATDDSYTPEELRLSAGYAPDRLLQFHVHGPGASAADGWIRLSFDPPVLTHVLEIAITRNHQNGRDSRLHQVCVFGSRPELTGIASPPFSHPALVQWASIR